MYYNEARGEIAAGCEQCLLGAKSVIFITGLCPLDCFYCPVNRERFGKDVIYVNDIPVEKIEEIPQIVAQYGSTGAAFTGGDPAVVADRVKKIAELLKGEFGESFHVHMYTHLANLNGQRAGVLAASPVDEIRIHVTSRELAAAKLKYVKALVYAGKKVGVEVPALSGYEEKIADAVQVLSRYISFVNINELDVSEANMDKLKAMGYRIDGLNVSGSMEAARKIAELIRGVPVHICTGRTKDLIQLGARLFRHAIITAAPNELPNDDGTITYDEGGGTPETPRRAR